MIAIFCHRLLAGQAPVINGDGEQTRDYVYVEDVAARQRRWRSSVPRSPGAVNIGTGIETSVNDLYRALAQRGGLDGAAPQHAPARPGEQRRSCLDPALAARALGWQPTVSLARRPPPHLRVLPRRRSRR